MTELQSNPYRTPDAQLARALDDSNVILLGRFTAWGVFGLSIISIGIYPVYWMFTRARIINSFHDDEISPVLLYSLVVAVMLSTATLFLGNSEAELMAGGAVNLAYFVIYLVVLFKIRNRLQDIVNRAGDKHYKINIVLTFLFYAIYLQYKINECIDDLQSGE